MKCKLCNRTMRQTKWRPPKGTNPELRQQACPTGHYDCLYTPKRKVKKEESSPAD